MRTCPSAKAWGANRWLGWKPHKPRRHHEPGGPSDGRRRRQGPPAAVIPRLPGACRTKGYKTTQQQAHGQPDRPPPEPEVRSSGHVAFTEEGLLHRRSPCSPSSRRMNDRGDKRVIRLGRRRSTVIPEMVGAHDRGAQTGRRFHSGVPQREHGGPQARRCFAPDPHLSRAQRQERREKGPVPGRGGHRGDDHGSDSATSLRSGLGRRKMLWWPI